MTTASLYTAIRPSLLLDFANTKQLDPRVTFARASTGRYYDGKSVVKAEENLLPYSQEFDTWSKASAVITANATTAPDGTSTADSLIESASTSFHFVYQYANSVAGNSYTFSAYAKANTRNWIKVNFSQAGNFGAYFDLTNGVVGTVNGGVSANITSVGNGWYRCTATYTATQTGNNQFQLWVGAADNFGSYAGDGTSGIYIWGAQLEQRSTLTAYTPTTTQPITNYIPALQTAAAGVPRFDHDPITGESKGLLIEEQRTNLLTYSEQFGSWGQARTTVQSDVVVSPNGLLSGDKLIKTSAAGAHYTYQIVSGLTVGNAYTYTVFAKASEYQYLVLIEQGANTGCMFNLSTGAFVKYMFNAVVSYSSVNVGNGWWRYSITITCSNTSTAFIAGPVASSSEPNLNTDGDGYSGIYIWGAQLEAGSFPTSYIPTVESQVTRSADSASMTGSNFSSWYRADEGTLQIESSVVSSTGVFGISTFVDNSTRANFMEMLSVNGSGYQDIAVNGVETAVWNTGKSINVNKYATAAYVKSVLAYKTNDANAAVNGVSGSPSTNCVIPRYIAKLDIGNNHENRRLIGYIKRIAYYPKRLSDAELQGITS